MRVHVYRNRRDDQRPRSQLHFCTPCGGWYGVPHDGNHCQDRRDAGLKAEGCACRFCRESCGKEIEGAFGFFTETKRWQP